MLALASVLCGGLLVWGPGTAVAQNNGQGYSVTFVARWCPNYTDVYANRSRNNVLESLEDLGGNSPYGANWDAIPGVNQVLPEVEDNPAGTQQLAPPFGNGVCHPITGWTFSLGSGKSPRAVSGAWGALTVLTNGHTAHLPDGSSVTSQLFRTNIVTQSSTALLDQNGNPTGTTIPGAVTVHLTPEELAASTSGIYCAPYVPVTGLVDDECVGGLWAQGGTPTDPVNANQFGGVSTPTYAYAALRCAIDNAYGDNADWIQFPGETRHVFCYYYAVRPSPPAGRLTIKKVVEPPVSGSPAFPFTGSFNFDPNPVTLGNGQAQTFERAAGRDWTVTEAVPNGYHLVSITCDAPNTPGQSTASISGATAVIDLADGAHVTCTFTDQTGPRPPGLTITKITDGGVGTFRYVVTPASGGGAHRTSAQTHLPGVPADAAPSLTDLPAGTYHIHEVIPSSPDGRWRQQSVVCDDAPATRPVTVTISDTNPNPVCVFTNKFIPRGSISIGKITHGATGRADFVVSGVSGTKIVGPGMTVPVLDRRLSATTKTEGVEAAATPDSPGLDDTNQLRLGRYRITEEGLTADHWSLTGVTCNGVQVPFAQGAIEADLTRSQPHLHCVFTNTFTRHPPPEPAPDPGPDAQPALQRADLVVTKRASTPVATSGSTVVFRITVSNHGPDHAARVMLHDQLFGSATVVAISTDVGRCSAGLLVVCDLGTLRPGARAHITVRLRLTGTSRFRDRAVVGTATSDPNLRNNVDSVTVRLSRPSAPPPFTG